MALTALLKIEDRIFRERPLRMCGLALAEAYAIIAGWFFVNGGLIRPDGTLQFTDFSWMWLSAIFAASDPAQIYNSSAFWVDAAHLVGEAASAVETRHFDYPPTFLLFLYPFGFMPYVVAFLLWLGVTLIVYLTAIYAIVPRIAALFVAVTPLAPVLANVHLGHNGFLTAGLMGLSLATMEDKPWLSGLFLGMLTYKPQLGVLFPIALLVSRNWRVFASATVTATVMGLTATIGFGYEGWSAFIAANFDLSSTLDRLMAFQPQSIYGMLYRAGADIAVARAGQLSVSTLVALLVCLIWAKKSISHLLKAAALCTGSVMFTPYVQNYDLCILSIAVAFLVSDGIARGFLPGERILILMCWASSFFFAYEIGPIISAALLFVVGMRIIVMGTDLMPHVTRSLAYSLTQQQMSS